MFVSIPVRDKVTCDTYSQLHFHGVMTNVCKHTKNHTWELCVNTYTCTHTNVIHVNCIHTHTPPVCVYVNITCIIRVHTREHSLTHMETPVHIWKHIHTHMQSPCAYVYISVPTCKSFIHTMTTSHSRLLPSDPIKKNPDNTQLPSNVDHPYSLCLMKRTSVYEVFGTNIHT